MTLTASRARCAAAAALVLPILVLFLPWFAGSGHLWGHDLEAYYRPHGLFARETWRQDGELPRWNPYQYAGVPFVGNNQGNLYYPPNGLFLVLPPELAIDGLIFLHLLLAAVGMYRLTRYFGRSRVACVLASLSYSLSFSILFRIHAGHLPYIETIAQAPLLLYLAVKAVDRPTLLHAAGLAAMIALVLTAGNPQFVYHLGLLSIGLVVWRIATRVERRRPALAILGAGLLGGAVSAVSLLPSFEVAAWSARGGSDPEMLTRLAEQFHEVGPAQFVSLAVPFFPWTPGAEMWLPHEKSLYLGILPLSLALFGLASERPRGPALFFAAAAGAALLDGIGAPVHSLLSLLPGYSRFRIPERVFWISVLSLSILCAFGWDAAARSVENPRRRKRILAGLGVTALVGALGASLRFRAPELLIFAALAAASLAIVERAPRDGRIAALAIALTALDLVGYGFLRLRWIPSADYDAPPWYDRYIAEERHEYRLVDMTRIDASPMARGFHLLRGCGHPVPPALCAYYASGWKGSRPRIETLPDVAAPGNPDVLRRLKVRWIVAGDVPPVAGWTAIARQGRSVLYADPSPGPILRLEGTEGEAVIRSRSANAISVEARCRGAGRLLLAESWASGWRAEQNGAPVLTRAGPGELLEIDVPDGSSRTTLVYAPRAWRVGAWISLPALGILALLALAGVARRKRQEAPPPVR